jgi:hypothetical protein
LARWQVGVNGLVSSIEAGITGGGLIQDSFRRLFQWLDAEFVPVVLHGALKLTAIALCDTLHP